MTDLGEKKKHKNNAESQKDLQLGPTKVAEEKERRASDNLKARVSDKEKAREKGENLYEMACDYLKNVLTSVKQGKCFLLDPGFQIINEMVALQFFTDTLFLKTFHDDAPHEFIVTHPVDVAIYAIKMAEHLDWGKDRQVEIGMSALLHDVGMGLIPDKLLFKEDRLNDGEYLIIKERSNYAYHILNTFKEDLVYLARCALHVNERLDGSGYPIGLKGDEIHEYAQIIGLLDMYEALTHSRPWRERFRHFSAIKEIIKLGKNIFQKRHLRVLLNIFSIFPIFSYVRLNSNAIGRVIETYPDQPMRPKIQIVFDSQNKRLLAERIINLQENPFLAIIDSVSEKEVRAFSKGPAL
jgi:HD-GYP domain-containing protein (c-di-GMP phosphodiesterase class II)